jgi:hypothetical protein
MAQQANLISPLASRKQLLIAESELNRAQLSAEWQTMTRGILDVVHRATTTAAWVSSAALVVAGVTALRRRPAEQGAAKSSRFQKALNGAHLVSRFWLAFRTHGEKEKLSEPHTPATRG